MLDPAMNESALVDKVAVHYADGRVVKGHTSDFNAAHPAFTLRPIDCGGHDGSSIRIDLHELKAVFFVRDFAGDPEYAEWKHFVTPRLGTRIAVKFTDGEVMIGAELPFTTEYGIYLFPADRASNNEKVFIVKGPAVTLIEQAPEIGD